MRLLAQSDQGGRPDGVHVDVNGIVYATDFNAGLSVMEFLD